MHRPPTQSDQRLDARLLVARIQFGTGLLFVVSFVAFAIWGRFPVPYRDDWDWLYACLSRPFTMSAQFEPHNEHLIPLPRLLFALQYWLEGAEFRLSFLGALAAQLLIGWVFWRQIRRRWSSDPAMRWFAWGLTAVCLFFAYQLQSMVFVAAILFPLVQLFAVFACDAAAKASAVDALSEDPRPGRTALWALAFTAAAAAALTTTNGLVAPAIVALFGLTSRRRTPVWVVPGLAAVLVSYMAIYVGLVGRPWEPATTAGQPASLASLVGFFLAFFGSGLVYWGSAAGVGLGGLVFAAGCAALLVTARDGTHRPQIERFACGLLIFTIGSAAMTTFGRAQFGLTQAAQSRYATYTLVYWSALIVWALSGLDRGGVTARLKLPVMSLAAAVTTAGLLVQVFVGLVWIAKKENIRAASLALEAGVDDEEWVSTLHPITKTIYSTRALLAAQGSWTLADPRIGTAQGLSTLVQCDGGLQLEKAVGGQGWRAAGVLHTGADSAVIADRAGIAIGLAEPAPLVSVPNPSQMDVVRAVWLRLTKHNAPDDRWIGLARPGAGPPYTLFALDEEGGAACKLPVPVTH